MIKWWNLVRPIEGALETWESTAFDQVGQHHHNPHLKQHGDGDGDGDIICVGIYNDGDIVKVQLHLVHLTNPGT